MLKNQRKDTYNTTSVVWGYSVARQPFHELLRDQPPHSSAPFTSAWLATPPTLPCIYVFGYNRYMPKSVSLAAVQMQYRLEDYRSAEAFRERVLGVSRAVRQRAPKGDLLVVFPEDVGLGLIFTQDFERVQTAKTMVEAGLRLMERYQINAFATEGGFAGATRALLRTLSPFVERVYHEVFSEAARVGGAWVVAGSAPIAQGECVHNVCYTYNPKGERVLVQRKINLVPLEQEAGLNLCPAPRELPTVNTPAGKLGVLICLDGFYHELIDQHAKRGVRLIAMPSFNPLPWTKEEAQGWESGLLAGVQKHPDLIGVNPMGVGGFFDVRAEGQSSIVAQCARTPDGSGYLARAKSKSQEEILTYPM